MKRTLRKKAAKKTILSKTIVSQDLAQSEIDFILLFAAVVALFFAVLTSQALGSVLRSAAAIQAKTDQINNYVDGAELQFNNRGVLDQLNSLNQPDTIKK